MNQPVISTPDTKRHRRHSLDFKLTLVMQTMQSGASVARIARENGVNANQLFAWRKLYREGALGAAADTSTALLPVKVIEPAPVPSTAACSSRVSTRTASMIRLECSNGSLTIEGVPDRDVLDRVLERLLR